MDRPVNSRIYGRKRREEQNKKQSTPLTCIGYGRYGAIQPEMWINCAWKNRNLILT